MTRMAPQEQKQPRSDPSSSSSLKNYSKMKRDSTTSTISSSESCGSSSSSSCHDNHDLRRRRRHCSSSCQTTTATATATTSVTTSHPRTITSIGSTTTKHGRPTSVITYMALILTLLSAFLLRQDDAGGVLATTNELIASSNSHSNNYNRIRGQVISKDTSGEELFRVYQRIQRDYQDKAFHPKNTKGWKTLNQKDGVQVKILHHPSDPSCPYVQMKAVFPVSLDDCWSFLKLDRWDETMKIMDPFYEGVHILGEYRHKGAHMLLARKRTQRMLTFGKRDFVFVSVSDTPLADGTWVSGTVSVISDAVPRQKHYTRAYQDSIAFYKPLASEKTELTIVCRMDLNDHGEDGAGGSMPMWLYVKTIGSTGARSVINMREHLIQQVQTRKQEEQQQQAERRRVVHVSRESKLREQVLPWMEWPILTATTTTTTVPSLMIKRRKRHAIFATEEEVGVTDEVMSIESVSIGRKLHQFALPWMEWPGKQEFNEPLPGKKKTLKQKIHEKVLPWMEWSGDQS